MGVSEPLPLAMDCAVLAYPLKRGTPLVPEPARKSMIALTCAVHRAPVKKLPGDSTTETGTVRATGTSWSVRERDRVELADGVPRRRVRRPCGQRLADEVACGVGFGGGGGE